MNTMKPGSRLLMLILLGLLVMGGGSQAADDLERLAQEFMQQYSAKPLGFKGKPALDLYALLFHKREPATVEALTDQSMLAPHDAYRLIFSPLGDYYVYMFQVSVTGKITLIFPELTFEGFQKQYYNPVTLPQYTIPAVGHVIDIGYPPLLKDLYILISSIKESYLTDLYRGMNQASMIGDQLTMEEHRAALLSSLLLHEDTVSVYHIQPRIYHVQDNIASPVMVKEIVAWLNDHSEQSVWIPKGINPPGKHVPRITLFDIFQPGSDVLTAAGKAILSAYGSVLREHKPDVQLSIAVYTDVPGTANENTRLAQQQADRLLEFLSTECQVDSEQIKVQGYGNAYPLVRQDTEHYQQINNRIELIRR